MGNSRFIAIGKQLYVKKGDINFVKCEFVQFEPKWVDLLVSHSNTETRFSYLTAEQAKEVFDAVVEEMKDFLL